VSFEELLIDDLAIWRSSPGPVDEYNQPTTTFALLAAVAGRVVAKSGREMAQTNQTGPRAGQYRVFMSAGVDVAEGDHIVRGTPPEVYEIGFVAERRGATLHHLELDCTKVYP
jgi:hypothetical protein